MRRSSDLPLFALLSQALVAFTIEFDNKFEHRAPHRTTRHGSTGHRDSSPWLVSMAFWLAFIRFVPADGTTVRDWKRAAGLTTAETRVWLRRLSDWWNILSVEKRQMDDSGAWVIRPTPGGHKCIAVWLPLAGAIESQWEKRFGAETVALLRNSLSAILGGLDRDFPDHLPVLGFDLLTEDRPHPGVPADGSLPALLTRVLLAFALEFERESKQSLAIGANGLRLVDANGVPVRDLPRLSGLSKEAAALIVKRLVEQGWVRVQLAGRSKLLLLTPEGERAKQRYETVVNAIESRWAGAFGRKLADLRAALEQLAGDGSAASPLFSGLHPYPDNWRAALPAAETLPHYPMILHRGGYPDGS